MERTDIVDLLTAKIPDQKGERKRDWMSTVENIQDVEVKILEIEADKLVDIELGGYCE